jgi:hypothetical protein
MAAFSLGPELGVIVRTPEKPPVLKKEFAVSDLLRKRLPAGVAPADGWMTAVVLGISVDIVPFVYRTEDEAADAMAKIVAAFESIGLPVDAVAGKVAEEFDGPVLVLKEPSVEERFLGEDESNMRAVYRGTVRADLEVLGRFSRATGLRIRYCLAQNVTQPPLPDEEHALNVFIGCRAPGNFRFYNQRLKDVFGLKVWDEGGVRFVHGPTPWRGRLLSTEGVPVFQILGSNVYNLVHMVTEETNSFDRGPLWERMLGMLARDLFGLTDHDAPAPVEPDPETEAQAMAVKRCEDLRKDLEKLDFELQDLLKRYAEKLRDRDDKAIGLKALKRELADLGERNAEDFRRLRAMPDIVSFRVSADDGLLAETVPIALEREGRRYDLGPFRIHLSPGGKVAVWSEAPRHPQGHHHPHVDKTHLQCFGNVGLAIVKQATAYRFADAVELIVKWLRSYWPQSTLIPLEEFPSEPIASTQAPKGASRETRKKARAELLPAAEAAGSESPASGDADRRRRGGKPRRRRARPDGRPESDRLGRR